jgi:enoyl-CoA hydratase
MAGIHVRMHKRVLWLIIDCDHQNALTVELLDQLAQALGAALKRSPRLVVLTGMGEHAFCSGLDAVVQSESQHTDALHSAERITSAFETLRAQSIPTVALVKGCALDAGCELLLFCDTVVAREDATFKLPTLDNKLFSTTVSVYLPALVGQEAASRLLQAGRVLTAQEALRAGLVHQVLSMQRFLPDAEELLVMLSATT